MMVVARCSLLLVALWCLNYVAALSSSRQRRQIGFGDDTSQGTPPLMFSFNKNTPENYLPNTFHRGKVGKVLVIKETHNKHCFFYL
jgi:hypothetical protein